MQNDAAGGKLAEGKASHTARPHVVHLCYSGKLVMIHLYSPTCMLTWLQVLKMRHSEYNFFWTFFRSSQIKDA